MQKNMAMMGVAASALLVGVLIVLAPGAAAAESKSADEVVEMIDALVFHTERQEGVNGYLATVTERYRAQAADGGDAQGEVQSQGKLEVDALAKTRTLTLDDGATRELGAFRPSCGPWSLNAVMQVETTLFSTPLAEQFPAEDFERFVARRAGGFALRIKPKTPIGSDPQPLRPVITTISIHTDANGLPLSGELALDMAMMDAKAKLEFAFDEVDGRQRVRSIGNDIAMANIGVKPTLTFGYAEVEGVTLLESVTVAVDAADLSEAMAQMIGSVTTIQTFSDLRVMHATPHIPDDWSGVSLFYLRRMMGEAFPGDEITARLPAATAPAKESRVGAYRRRMYLAHGVRLAFDSADVLVEALIQVRTGNGFDAFEGELGEGLTVDSTRATVAAELGAPATSKSSSRTTTDSYPALGLDIVYEGKAAADSAPVVTIILRPAAAE